MYAPVDENFPSKRQVLAAVGLALLTGLAGFGLSYSWFLAHHSWGSPAPVDRRAAEAGVPKFAQKSANSQRWDAPPSFLIVSGSGYRWPEKKERALPKEVEEMKQRLAMPLQAPSAPQPKKVAKVDVLPGSAYPEGHASGSGNYRRPTGRPTPLAEVPISAPTQTSAFPPAGNRPPARSLQDGWSHALGSVVLIQGFADQTCYGVLVDNEGTVLTHASPMLENRGIRAIINGVTVPVLDVVGYEPQYEIAVLKVSPTGSPAPLAPEAPSVAEELALAPGAGLPANLQTAEVLESTPTVGQGTFRFQGAIYPSNAGSPLVNSRGEVIGMVLGKPWAYPGQNYCIGADNSVLWSVMQKARSRSLAYTPGPPESLSRAVRALMLSELRNPGPWSAPSRANSRALPGESLGMYSLGMTRDDLERAFGAGKVQSFPGGFNTVQVDQYPLRFTLLDDRVVAISTTDRFYATHSGVGVGMDASAASRDPAFSTAVTGFGPGGRRQLVARGIGLNLDAQGTAESLIVVSEPVRSP